MSKAFEFLPETYREALALHDIINTFGVPVEHIFVSRSPEGKFFMIAKEEGKQFAVDVGATDLGQNEFESLWDRAVETYNSSATEDREWLLDRSKVRQSAALLVAGLVAQGFVPRSLKKVAQA